MAEGVNTGGTVRFEYGKGYDPKFSEEEKQGIRDAYQASYERKARERRNKIIIYSVVALIVIAIIFYLIFR
jgi:predicted nucleic acid-binding Zn ribbon protein